MHNQYTNTQEHIQDAFILADLLLHLEVLKDDRQIKTVQNVSLQNGLYITEEKISSIVAGNIISDMYFNREDDGYAYLEKAIHAHKQQIQHKVKNSIANNTELKLVTLQNLFQLTDNEMLMLIVCLAIPQNPNYRKIVCYLAENNSNALPTINLLQSILHHSAGGILIGKNHLAPNSPLLKNGLLQIINTSGIETSAPAGNDQVQVPDRIIDFLFDRNTISHELADFSQLYNQDTDINTKLMPEEITKPLKNILKQKKTGLHTTTGNMLLYFHGTRGTGKETTAQWLCGQLHMPLITVDLELALNSELPITSIMRLLHRESMLTGCALYFRGMEQLFTAEAQANKRLEFIQQIINFQGLLFLSSREPLGLARQFAAKEFFSFSFAIPGFTERKVLWQHFTDDIYTIDKNVDLDAISNKFQLSCGQIQQAIKEAHNLSLLRTDNDTAITTEDLTTACRAQSNHKLTELATKIEPGYTWDDIILPEKQKQQLREIVNRANHRHIVYDAWEHGIKHSLGKGLSALFAGPSGTGKTMAAEIMANELQLDLYKIDLSTVVSKYIGETEKNLSKIFKEAETSNAILFFDEADALFGARSEVKDAHDRYANIEVGYLLQKMDEYQGIAILATNLKNNMDKAFLRRIQFLVHFSDPDEQQRTLIWQKTFTNKTPLADDIDFAFLARQFKLTGGNIKNIGLGASFIAASNGKLVTMEHVIHATGREWNKIGRACTRQEFAEYYELVK